MKIPIEKELFKILEDLNRRHHGAYNVDLTQGKDWYGTNMTASYAYTYSFAFDDDEAIRVLADMGFIEVKHLHPDTFQRIYLKNDFITQVGLALFREHDNNTEKKEKSKC